MTETKSKILIVDDDEQIRKQMDWALREEHQVRLASDRTTALASLREERPRVVILDLGLPPHPRDAREGLALLEEILREDLADKVVIISGNVDRDNALRAIQLGAADFFSKPVDLDELKVVLGRALFLIELEAEEGSQAMAMAPATANPEPFEELLGTSPRMLEIFQRIARAAPVEVPVLITGESGTGKELIARAIHRRSLRRDGPFVPINSGAVQATLLESEFFGHEKGAFTGAVAQRKGRFEQAQGGTLFLDEIGDLELGLQVKLLRFLQDGFIERVGSSERIRIDTRVVAATHRELKEMVAKGQFREDLYYRLAVFAIEVPPLRDRAQDLLLLASAFLRKFAANHGRDKIRGFSPQAEEAILAYPWPGNVRELENRILRAIVMTEGSLVTPRELELQSSPEPRPAPGGAADLDLNKAIETIRREKVQKAMAEAKGNISQAAKLLHISRPTLYELLEKFGIKEPRG